MNTGSAPITTTNPADGRTTTRRSTSLAAALAWVLPGLGHWYLGLRGRAIVLFVTITVTFWCGVAVGGVQSTVNAGENGAWLAAQLCAGVQTVAALMWSKSLSQGPELEAIYPAVDIAVVYAGIAGLLNLLVIIDALARAESSEGPRPPVTATPGDGGRGRP
jgi:hypothetical protein